MTPPNALEAMLSLIKRAMLYNREATAEDVVANMVEAKKEITAILAQHALASEAAAYELFQVAKSFVAWADDCWGSWAINDKETPKAKAEYLAAKDAIAKFESLASPSEQPALAALKVEVRREVIEECAKLADAESYEEGDWAAQLAKSIRSLAAPPAVMRDRP